MDKSRVQCKLCLAQLTLNPTFVHFLQCFWYEHYVAVRRYLIIAPLFGRVQPLSLKRKSYKGVGHRAPTGQGLELIQRIF